MAWVAHYKYIIAVGIDVPQMKDDNCSHSLNYYLFSLLQRHSLKVSFFFHVHMLFFVTVNNKVPQTW